jgi:general stress protein 26
MENTLVKKTQNLTAQEAIDKLTEFIKSESLCFFCTKLVHQPITTRPMSTQKVDELGNIWFMSSNKSHNNTEISHNNQVQLYYSNPSNYEFLSVSGNASVHNERSLIHEMWTPFAEAWFENGKDDADISLIKISPSSGYFRANKSNKMISMIKTLASTIAGRAPEGGVGGTLKL